jgi:hypothetical protein
VSKIVIGALTAAAWFALSYVAARAECVAGQICDQPKCFCADTGRANPRAMVHGWAVAFVP